jgi:hypothetical protein
MPHFLSYLVELHDFGMENFINMKGVIHFSRGFLRNGFILERIRQIITLNILISTCIVSHYIV